MSDRVRPSGTRFEMPSIFNSPLVEPAPETRHSAAGAVARTARDRGWAREEAVQVLRALGLDDVPVVAAAFARHGVASDVAARSA
ncbi:hypothetical protein [Nocardioides pakistanensis]